LFINTNGLVSLVNPTCRKCGNDDISMNDPKDRTLIKKIISF